jgi:hypothetical protein
MYVPSPASTAELLEMTLFPFSAPEFLKASADADELGAGIPQAFTATDRSVKIRHQECGLEKKEFTDGVGTIAPKFCGRDQNTAKRVRIEPRVKPRQSIGIPLFVSSDARSLRTVGSKSSRCARSHRCASSLRLMSKRLTGQF